MNSNFAIEPAAGYVALEFLSGDSGAGPVLANCLGSGADVTVCKRGDTVEVDAYAREGLRIDDGVYLVEAYQVKRVV